SGRAVEVTTALFETALMWVSYQAAGYLASGEVPQPQGSGTAMIAPYQAFPTADGFTMIGAGSDALFARLTSALGTPGLADDPRCGACRRSWASTAATSSPGSATPSTTSAASREKA